MGTWIDIDNGEGGSSVRNKINAAFQHLFGWIANPPEEEDQSKWQEQGANDITPKDEKGVVAPTINAGQGAFSEIDVAGFTVATDGKIFADHLKEVVPMPLLIDTDGRIRTPATIDTYTVTINFIRPSLPGSITEPAPITGEVFFTRYGSTFIETIQSNSVSFTVENGTWHYTAHLNGFVNMSGDIVVNGAVVTVNLTVSPEFGIEPEDVTEGRDARYINTGEESNFINESPFAIVDRDNNYDLQLPNPSTNRTVERTARKAQTGGALTLNSEGGFMLNDEINNVLTTTTKGAWVRVKAMDVGGTYRWVVIMDSGDWELGE